MPELPEVETVVRALRRPLVRRAITEVRNDWPGHIVTPSLEELRWRIHGRTILHVNRRAKYLVFTLSGGETLIIHLKMSGHLAVVGPETPPDKYTHTTFKLDNGQELRFRDTRKFGRVYLVQEPAEILGHLGPEPLADSFTAAALQERLYSRKRVLKPLLLDQTFVAGIGNIYADEALYYAGLHPERRSDSLSTAEIEALHSAIQKVLKLGIEREGASIATYVKPDGSKGEMQNDTAVYDRESKPCYHCGTPIQRIKLGGRSTHFCPTCQLKNENP
jgi:formamidopyrimidine-DNA glycosylase